MSNCELNITYLFLICFSNPSPLPPSFPSPLLPFPSLPSPLFLSPPFPLSSPLPSRPTQASSVLPSTPTATSPSTRSRSSTCSRVGGGPRCHHTSTPLRTIPTLTCCRTGTISPSSSREGGEGGTREDGDGGGRGGRGGES